MVSRDRASGSFVGGTRAHVLDGWRLLGLSRVRRLRPTFRWRGRRCGCGLCDLDRLGRRCVYSERARAEEHGSDSDHANQRQHGAAVGVRHWYPMFATVRTFLRNRRRVAASERRRISCALSRASSP